MGAMATQTGRTSTTSLGKGFSWATGAWRHGIEFDVYRQVPGFGVVGPSQRQELTLFQTLPHGRPLSLDQGGDEFRWLELLEIFYWNLTPVSTALQTKHQSPLQSSLDYFFSYVFSTPFSIPKKTPAAALEDAHSGIALKAGDTVCKATPAPKPQRPADLLFT